MKVAPVRKRNRHKLGNTNSNFQPLDPLLGSGRSMLIIDPIKGTFVGLIHQTIVPLLLKTHFINPQKGIIQN